MYRTSVERIRTLTLLLGLGLVLTLAGCHRKGTPESSMPVKVSVVTLKAQPIKITSNLPGRVVAYRVAEVRPQVSGIVLKRLFVEGSDVKAGQQLYQIDAAPYQAAYDSAKATAVSARALAERNEQLLKDDAVSRQDYENAVAANLQAKAALETAHINLIYTKVLAPISGRIGRSNVTEGALVTANQAVALATVQQLNKVYVDVTQPSSTLLRLRRAATADKLQQTAQGETPAHLRLEDNSDYAQSGTLKFSEVSVDEGTGSVTLRAVFPNPDRLLLPGMFVHEIIEEGVRPDAVLAPQQGVTHNQKGEPTALVVNRDNIVQLRTLQTESAIGDQWLVTDGLKPGDRVIVEGLEHVKVGARVVAEEYRPPTPQARSGTAQP